MFIICINPCHFSKHGVWCPKPRAFTVGTNTNVLKVTFFTNLTGF